MGQPVMGRRRFGSLAAPLLAAGPLAACVGTPGQLVPVVPFRRYELASDVLFDFGSATLRPEASEALAGILAQIRSVYPYPAIRVVGHTDSIGSDAANDVLSLRRAESVQRWLVEAGIPPAVITVEGQGKRQPLVPNTLPNGADSPEGRMRNRRVELIASPAG